MLIGTIEGEIFDPERARLVKILRDKPFQDFLAEFRAIKRSPIEEACKLQTAIDTLPLTETEYKIANALAVNFGYLNPSIDTIRQVWGDEHEVVFTSDIAKIDREKEADAKKKLKGHELNLKNHTYNINRRFRTAPLRPEPLRGGYNNSAGISRMPLEPVQLSLIYAFYRSDGTAQSFQDLYPFICWKPVGYAEHEGYTYREEDERKRDLVTSCVCETRMKLEQTRSALRIDTQPQGYRLVTPSR